ncbi:protein O-linked-mannose beta-1,2-N-acetylglucosaminyltransferase 1-like [Cherax quadricarinatus]|uniref:protein O-linked-mannose beta-1,2-N-acetylglucosaminyltransferase 1-like n=1 Tax=Cherax quadricarinatus TaxID=27406 RepID=UPI00387ECF9A
MYNLHKYADNLSLPSTFRSISRGRVMILAVKRDAGLNMPRGVRDLLQELGSFRTHLLPFRGYMSWVFTSWGPSWGECVVDHTGFSQGKTTVDSGSSLRKTTRNVSTYLGEISDQSGSSLDTVYYSQSSSEQALFRLIKETDIYASPVHLEVTVPLLRKGDCWGSPDGREAERRTFCRNFDGYGDLCNCDHPAPLTYAPKQLENSVIDDVPVVIIASSRPQALYRCLVTVLRQEGGVISKILVLLDGYNPEMVALLRLLQVNHRVHHMGSESFVTSGARISLHYRYALHAVFSTFPAASKAIILEEDILAAPDFFSYFNQTSWLLDTDPSIFCISAWNDLGSLHIARHISRLYRVETHAGYGWMLTRKLFNEIYPLWQHPNKTHDWDIWLRSTQIRGGRECIVPDVSRSFHSGLLGIHIHGALAHAFFTAHPVTAASAIPLHNIHRMTLTEYEEDLFRELESDTVFFLNNTRHPCSTGYIPRNFTAGPVVLFITMTSKDQFNGWKKLASCIGVWGLDHRSHHRGLFRLTFYNTQLYIIGYPYSDYSYIKPSWIHVITPPSEKEEFVLGRRTLENRANFRRPELENLSPYLLTEGSTPEPIFE